jgi:hypothetical protein
VFYLKTIIMSKFLATTFGKISGRHGTAVAADYHGTSILKVFTPPSNPRSPKQVAHRAKFAFLAKALHPFRSVFKETFGPGPRGIGRGFSIAFREAVTGEAPELSIDWSRVVVSTGGLLLPLPVNISLENGNRVTVTWDASLYNTATAKDKVSLAVLNESTRALIFFNARADRSEESFSFDLPANWVGTVLHVWLYLSNIDQTQFTDSVYMVID